MAQIMNRNTSEIDSLLSILSTTLDETIFFSELASHFMKLLEADSIFVSLINEDMSAKKLIITNKKVRICPMDKVGGILGHVLRTKKAYFSNDLERDPIFAEDDIKDMMAILAVPVVQDGLVIAIIHLQSKGTRLYSLEDVSTSLEILESVERPIKNMKMYLAAKSLNETLMRKLEVQGGSQPKLDEVQSSGSFKVIDTNVIVQSEKMKNILKLADKLALSDVNAIIIGPIGTGREMIARRIHCRSNRNSAGFVVSDCSVLSEVDLEKEIFGTESRDSLIERKGLIELGNRGTLLLKNIHGMSLNLQAKLARFIKEEIAFKYDSQKSYISNLRVLVTTDKDLRELVEANEFREELFYLLGSMVLSMPPLKERKEDIESLASSFLNEGKSIDEMKSLSPGAVRSLVEYNWPGNVRELKSIMQRSYILSDGRIIEKSHLADSVISNNDEQNNIDSEEQEENFIEMTLNELERKHICKTLEFLGGNKTRTAKVLGITVKTLYNKLHSYGLIQAQEV